DDQYVVKTLKRYYSDCSQMALIQSSYDFDLNQLRSGTNNFMDLLPKLKSPADFTVVYDSTPAGKGGLNVSCEDAWDNYIEPAWADNTLYDSMRNSVCTRSGFNVGEAAQLARCQDLLASINLDVFNFVGTSEHLLRQMAMANAIASAIQDENPDLGLRALSNRAVMVEGLGVAQSANQWIPTIRAVVLAIVLGIFPILVVFMITPLFARAIAAMFGLFAWITLWGIADALVHHSAMDLAINAVDEIQRHGMGLTAMMQSPEAALQSLGIFGKARGMGITIASLLSVMIFRLSAHSLAGMTASWQGRVDSAGADAANQTQTPEGSGATLDRLAGGAATAMTAGMMGFGRMATATAFGQQSSLEGQSQLYGEQHGEGKSLSGAAQTMGAIAAGASMGNVRATQANTLSKGGDPNHAPDLFAAASQVAQTEQAGRFGDADAKRATAEELGFSDVQQMNAYTSYMESLNRGTDARTHSANVERFQEAYQSRTGELLSDGQAAQMYSQVRMADITGRASTYSDDPAEAEAFFGTSQALQQFHQDGLLAGADKLGVSAFDLAEAGGRLNSARQQGDAKTLGALSMRDIALGSFANQVMSTNSGTEMVSLMSDRGFVSGTREMLGNEMLLRDAGAQQFSNLAQELGIPKEEAAMMMRGANMQLGLTGDQVAGLPASVIDSANIPLAGGGASAVVNLDSEGSFVDNAQVRTGTQFAADNSTFIHGGTTVTREAAGNLINPGQEDQFENVLRRIDNDPQSVLNVQSSEAAYLSMLSTSQLSVSDSKGAGGSVTGSVTAGTPGIAKGLFGVQAGVTAEGHVRQ
ncbi:MAG: conjugal transfer protein TraG N-terminal domain-containing protein, partial [Gammaproteobacteria bacterium]|nr:conjugal transfer protein TraG N-terminal domain-containing protein [Gammaproteobacteria bacterium]